MKGIAYSLAIVLLSSLVYGADSDSLTLDVSYRFRAVRHFDPEIEVAVIDYYFLEVRSFVTNISAAAIKIPTETYDRRPSVWFHGRHVGAGFRIESRRLNDRVMVAAPERFLPVVLQPGMSAELPAYEVRLQSPEGIERVIISYSVDDDIAQAHGWWTGSLVEMVPFKAEGAEPGATDNPDDAR